MVVAYNTNISVYRLSSGTKKNYVFSHSGGAFIEPAGGTTSTIYDELPGGKLYRIFSDSLNIQVGDKITEGENDYYVRGVESFHSFLGNHSEIIANL